MPTRSWERDLAEKQRLKESQREADRQLLRKILEKSPVPMEALTRRLGCSHRVVRQLIKEIEATGVSVVTARGEDQRVPVWSIEAKG